MSALESILLPPPGAGRVPASQDDAFLAYVDQPSVNWSEELEQLHEQSSREHFLDVWTRRAMLRWLGPLPERPAPGAAHEPPALGGPRAAPGLGGAREPPGPGGARAALMPDDVREAPVIADIGCSTGHLLADLQRAYPAATLIGVDLVASGLRKAHVRVPRARLLQADVCALPLRGASLDAVLSANLLEHVPDDVRALAELQRVLRPGARAVAVVPAGPGAYDYYDRFLGHERRYRRGELAAKARGVGLEVLLDLHLGSLLYPPFWLAKQRNRRRFGQLTGAALAQRVAADIAGTQDSRIGVLACRLERWLLEAGARPPFGIRGLTVMRRPRATAQTTTAAVR